MTDEERVLDSEKRVSALNSRVKELEKDLAWSNDKGMQIEFVNGRLEKKLALAQEALEKFFGDFDRIEKRQHELLVEGQTLESASKNWDSFPEDFSIDVMGLRSALEVLRGSLKSASGDSEAGKENK